MADTPSVRVDKAFTYRGSEKIFSNRYHFNGGVPADNGHWDTLFDAIVAAEKHIYKSFVQIRKATGFAAGSDLPVHDKTYAVDGDADFFSGLRTPGDCAAVLRYATTARSSKNHPIYLFNYFHGALYFGTGTVDELDHDQRTAIGTYADAWMTGFSDGTITAVRAGPHGATATAKLVLPEVRHRDFPG